MLTNAQKAFLKRLQRQAKLADEDYRALFPKVTGWLDCRSSTDGRLTQRHMDDLKAELLALAQPANLTAQLKQQAMPRRRLEHRLGEISECLDLYVDDVAGYIARVVADKFGVPADGALTLDDLSHEPTVGTKRNGQTYPVPSQFEQLVMTLWARLQVMRRDEGHTLHQMKCLADVPCACAICVPRSMVVVNLAEPEPELVADPF